MRWRPDDGMSRPRITESDSAPQGIDSPGHEAQALHMQEARVYGAANPPSDAASRGASRPPAAAASSATAATQGDPFLGPVDPTGSEVIQFTSSAPGRDQPAPEARIHPPTPRCPRHERAD